MKWNFIVERTVAINKTWSNGQQLAVQAHCWVLLSTVWNPPGSGYRQWFGMKTYSRCLQLLDLRIHWGHPYVPQYLQYVAPDTLIYVSFCTPFLCLLVPTFFFTYIHSGKPIPIFASTTVGTRNIGTGEHWYWIK